jgi:hypothetical protein
MATIARVVAVVRVTQNLGFVPVQSPFFLGFAVETRIGSAIFATQVHWLRTLENPQKNHNYQKKKGLVTNHKSLLVEAAGLKMEAGGIWIWSWTHGFCRENRLSALASNARQNRKSTFLSPKSTCSGIHEASKRISQHPVAITFGRKLDYLFSRFFASRDSGHQLQPRITKRGNHEQKSTSLVSSQSGNDPVSPIPDWQRLPMVLDRIRLVRH